jgi:hypothetical protein
MIPLFYVISKAMTQKPMVEFTTLKLNGLLEGIKILFYGYHFGVLHHVRIKRFLF